MVSERVQRRLAAVVSADVVGYSKMMGLDEPGTLTRLKALRSDFLHPKIAEYGGRIVKTTGDGTLIEFPSVVDAVCHAVDVQQGMAGRNFGLPEDQQIQFRLGINVGDIIIEGEDIFGDGVNVAARLEALADPGGICISGKVYEEVRDRVDISFEDLGEREVKNISRPVRVWRWQNSVPQARPAKEAKLTDRKPLLAVLTFDFLGDDSELANLSRVLSRDVTTEMAGRTGFKLIAATTVARFEREGDRAIDAVHKNLGADFVLCGTVTGNAKRVRVQVELIETNHGSQIWAERYDRPRGDLLSLADDLTDVIVQSSRTASNAYIGSLYEELPDEALSNNERLAKAARYFYRLTPGDYDRALDLINIVLASEPDQAMALTMRAIALGWQNRFTLVLPTEDLIDHIDALIERALELDPRSDAAFWARGDLALFLKGDVDSALADAERLLELNPHYSLGLALMGQALCYLGRVEDGIAYLRRSIDIDRRDPTVAWRQSALAIGLFLADESAEALKSVDKAIQTGRPFPEFNLVRTVVLEELGQHDEAGAELALLRRKHPDMTLATVRLPPFANPEYLRHFTDNLRAAGLRG